MDNSTTPQFGSSLNQPATKEEKIKLEILKLKKALRKSLGKYVKLEAA